MLAPLINFVPRQFASPPTDCSIRHRSAADDYQDAYFADYPSAAILRAAQIQPAA